MNSAKGGLLLRTPSSSIKTNVMPDGGETEAVFPVGDFGGRWPSKLEITSTVQLSSRVLEIKLAARNTGDEPEPIGIGWQPRFAVLNNNRSAMMLHLPSVTRSQQTAYGRADGKAEAGGWNRL